MTPPQRWNCAGWLILFALSLLSAVHWPVYPLFLDSYYHLSVIQGFREAGGPVLHAFWEAAPEGRPHLYPPLFHLLFLPGRMIGIPAISLARFWTWAGFPLLLLGVGWIFRRAFSARQAALTLVSLSIPYSFFLGSINHLPATGVLFLTVGIFWAMVRQRWLAGGLLLALAFWMHAGLPWLVFLALLIFGGFSREHRRTAWACAGIGLAGASPWLIHLARHAAEFQLGSRGEERMLETAPWMVLLGLAGIPLAWKCKGAARFWVALLIGFLPMALEFRFRFVAAQGLFPLLILAGFSLEALASRLKPWAGVAGLLALAFLSPSLHLAGAGRLVWADTTLSVLSGASRTTTRGNDQPLYQSRMIGEITRAVRAHTQPDELIYCNFLYVGWMISALSERALTNQLLRHVEQDPTDAQIRPARLVIWLKEPTGLPPPGLQETALRFHLRPLGETELTYLYFNPYAEGKKRAGRAVIPWGLAWTLIGLAIGGIFWDFKRSRSSGLGSGPLRRFRRPA